MRWWSGWNAGFWGCDMNAAVKLSKHEIVLLTRIRNGQCLVRTASQETEAAERGGGYLYATHPDGRKAPTGAAFGLISKGMLAPAGDELFQENRGGADLYALNHRTIG